MAKKGISKQNIAIIVLSILLLLSIVFGATYSYFNGSAENKIAGSITTATLKVDLSGPDISDSSSFSLHTGDNSVVPGQALSNTELRIKVDSTINTYMLVTYSMTIYNDKDKQEINTDIDPTVWDILDINPDAAGQNWQIYNHLCEDGKTKICSLVYMGDDLLGVFNPNVSHYPASKNIENNVSIVLQAGALRVPTPWTNDFQGKTIAVTFSAYVVQAEALEQAYPAIITSDPDDRREAIAQAIISEFGLDKTTAE